MLWSRHWFQHRLRIDDGLRGNRQACREACEGEEVEAREGDEGDKVFGRQGRMVPRIRSGVGVLKSCRSGWTSTMCRSIPSSTILDGHARTPAKCETSSSNLMSDERATTVTAVVHGVVFGR